MKQENKFLELPCRSRSSSISTQASVNMSIIITKKKKRSSRKTKTIDIDINQEKLIRSAKNIELINRFPKRINDIEEPISVARCPPKWHHSVKESKPSVLDLSFVCLTPGACDHTVARNHWSCTHVK